MSQCVPSWDLDDETTATPPPNRPFLRSHTVSTADVPCMLDYEVAELTWENGQVAMHAFGPPRLPAKPLLSSAKYAGWDKPRASGTLESIVNQATSTLSLPKKPPFDASNTVGGRGDELVTWLDHHQRAAMKTAVAAPSTTATTDALVPARDQSDHLRVESVSVSGVIADTGTIGVVGCSTRVESCSGATGAATHEDDTFVSGKHGSVARVPGTPDWSSRSQSVNGSATFGLTVDSTKTSDHDSVGHIRPQRKPRNEEDRKQRSTGKSSLSTKTSRAAAIHNQSERKRRDKINQRMKTLQKLVPNSSKTDKASMLDEVIEYLKNLQAQVQMMSRMNMPAMMLPMAMQQQLQMSMMAAAPRNMGMGIGMGMGMGMDMNIMGRPNIPGISPILPPTAFMPMPSWDSSDGDRSALMPDPLSAFLAYQTQQQPMTMDAYSMMAAMYQQFHQPPASSSKN